MTHCKIYIDVHRCPRYSVRRINKCSHYGVALVLRCRTGSHATQRPFDILDGSYPLTPRKHRFRRRSACLPPERQSRNRRKVPSAPAGLNAAPIFLFGVGRTMLLAERGICHADRPPFGLYRRPPRPKIVRRLAESEDSVLERTEPSIGRQRDEVWALATVSSY